MLSRIRCNVTTNTANIIYKSFIIPVLDYCDTVWNCCGKVNSDLVEELHRRAARLIVKHHSSDEALKNLAYKTMEARRQRRVYNLVRRCISGKVPRFFFFFFTFNRDVALGDKQGRLIYCICLKYGQKPPKSLFIIPVAKFKTVFKIICNF